MVTFNWYDHGDFAFSLYSVNTRMCQLICPNLFGSVGLPSHRNSCGKNEELLNDNLKRLGKL